jgi:RNA polymerase sigma-70 factor (ECF subfamily)
VDDLDRLAERFEHDRAHLRSVAYRMLGSRADADDAVQESWLRLSRSDVSGVENLSGWLTSVVARVCLDVLRSRKARREDRFAAAGESVEADDPASDPEEQAIIADSVGIALLIVLETLTPAERLAFVLHDMFAVPFEEIAPIVDKSPIATRQLASRARRRVQGSSGAPEADLVRQREVVDAFLAASKRGDFQALVSLLHPDAVLRADSVAVQMGATTDVLGAQAVAETFSGRARGARTALVGGAIGAVWTVEETPRVVFGFRIQDGLVVGIDLVADADHIAALDVIALDS